MKKSIFLLTINFFIFVQAFGQSPMPCTFITPQNYNYFGDYISSGNCLQVGNDVQNTLNISGSNYKEMKAGENIIFYPNTHIAPSGNGVFRAFIEKSDVDVVWFEPFTSSGDIGEYEKLEVGIKLPTNLNTMVNDFLNTYPDSYVPDDDINSNHNHPIYDESIGINPYNYNDINIQGIFVSPTGHQYCIDGFYMKNCIKDNNDSMIEIPTDYHFRLRFSPNEQGNWSFYVKILSLNNLFNTLQSLPYQFTCVPSDNPGYLEIGFQNRYLRFCKTQKSFFPIGINTPSPSEKTSWRLSSESAQVQKDLWNSIAAYGGNLVSLPFIVSEYCYEWEFPMVYDKYKTSWKSPSGIIYYYNENRQFNAREIDKLLDLARQNGLYAKVWVTPHQHFQYYNIDKNQNIWEWSPYSNHVSGVNSPEDFFTKANVINVYKNYLRYMIARWGYSTNIAWWEVMSEIDNAACNSETTSLWTVNMTQYMKSLDHNRHLVSASYATLSTQTFDYFNWAGDFVNIHDYGNHEQLNWDRADDVKDYLDDYNKPCIFGELGDGGLIDASEPISFHNDLWATAMMGCMGTGLNWHWYEINDSWHLSNMLALKNFLLNEDFESNDFHSERWGDGINSNSSTGDFESFQLINYSSTYGMGWVHNRWYWWYTIASCSFRNNPVNGIKHPNNPADNNHEAPIPLSGLKFTIKDLKVNEPYLIDGYYTTGNGGHCTSFNVTSNLWGRIKTTVPTTDNNNRDWAYKLTWLGNKNVVTAQENKIINDNNYEKAIKSLLQAKVDTVMQIYPNPGNGLVNISFPSNITCSIKVFNSLGVSVFINENLTFSKYNLDLTFLKSGVYYLIIATNDRNYIEKLVIEN